MKTIKTDVAIVGSGVSGLFAALHLPPRMNAVLLTKEELQHSDSYLAQGGICVLRDENDYDSFMEDTLKAGHYENRRESVDIMIRSSREIIRELIGYGVDFAREGEHLAYTREGCHSRPRILFHEDITGEEITSKLLEAVKKLPNITILEHTAMLDLIEEENCCLGLLAPSREKEIFGIRADHTILACGGIGGLYRHSTNYPHLTGDALAVSLRHGIRLEHLNYVQIHPTTLYSRKPGRRFLISESVRGEGAKLYNAAGERFASEVLPRDLLTAAIQKQMELDQKPFVWLDMTGLGEDTILHHFPHIYEHCLEEGFDVTKDWIPVVPAQHYFMGGIWVDQNSHTSMDHLYAVGETSCNGVHGANRLASNSLLESLVFARRAALHLTEAGQKEQTSREEAVLSRRFETRCQEARDYVHAQKDRLAEIYKEKILQEMKKENHTK